MLHLSLHVGQGHVPRCLRRATLFAGIAIIVSAGCRKAVRTDDPQLKPVQELLEAHLPPGTSEENVKAFLSERGYVILPSQKPGTLVAVVPALHDQEASPATVRVIFYFDANGKLNTFETTRASGEALQL